MNVKRSSLRACALLLILISAVLSLSAVLPVSAFAKPGDLGEPLSSYNMGSAKKLTGRNVIVSLFADSMYSRWTEGEKKEALEKLKTACTYLETEAAAEDIPLKMLYDWEADPDLSYTGRIFFPVDESEKFTELMDLRIGFWLRNTVSYADLLGKYEADGIAMMIFFKEEGRSYAICFDGEDIYEETLIVYSNANAATCAHELLHLFGAHDLYKGAEYTDDCVAYLKAHYPNELMLTVDEKDPKRIREKISPVTAYHIGWTDELKELSLFPQLKR